MQQWGTSTGFRLWGLRFRVWFDGRIDLLQPPSGNGDWSPHFHKEHQTTLDVEIIPDVLVPNQQDTR